MTRERLTLPEQNVREYANELAYRLAREQLAAISDIETQCQRASARYNASQNLIRLTYLNKEYAISFPGGKVKLPGSDAAVPIRDTILLLHYFTQAKGTPLSGKTITYKELHDGLNYYPTFAKRAIQPLVTFFGDAPEKLVATAAAFGGQKAEYGDTAVTITAFPRVPVSLVLWRGDKEFPPEGSILFDSTIADYLTNDDIHTLCETIAWRLVRLLKTGGETAG